MIKRLTILVLGILIGVAQISAVCAGGGSRKEPPLDNVLMGMKEQGVWYFLCTAPAFPHRIAPHYATYGPPPPPCGPVPCAPSAPIPAKVR
ncbi:MAG: hypothetical protein HY912_11045 [Desulfomonile tiedjei]|uniref:Uncharacterized protein n=1 Tax=Desulfomonile tiedjei TaxID=2358 RepID=A0A9D6Z3M5_9BACT|nr:hypothetical protein [Desulfomonile tiedjei]